MDSLELSNDNFAASDSNLMVLVPEYNCHKSKNIIISLKDDLSVLVSSFSNPQVSTGFSIIGNASQISNPTG